METSLKVIKTQLQEILKNFTWKIEVFAANNTFYNISNLKEIRTVLNNIESLGLFQNVVHDIQNSVIFTTKNDIVRIQQTESVIIDNQLKLLKSLAENFLNVLVSTVPEETVDSINIKLPPINDFDELSKVSRELHLALTQVIYNDEINGQTRIASVENGSIWLNVIVGATAVTLIGSLVWSAAVIYKKILEGKLLEQQIRGLKVKNTSLEDILAAQKTETQLIIQAEAEYLNSEFFKNDPAGNVEKLKNSVTIFADLIAKGAEIHPALVAPENVSNLFPDPTKIIGLESKIKRLKE